LSLETLGREREAVIFRSVSSAATFLLVIEVPLSEWIVVGMVPLFAAMAASMKRAARAPLSPVWTSWWTALRE